MADYWRSSGFHLLARDAAGHLRVTDDFLRAYVLRPEMRPVEDSCEAEQALHNELIEEPRRALSAARVLALADPDARENYRLFLDLRARLIAAGTVEACYVSLFAGTPVTLPPLFLDQLAHVILRNILGESPGGLSARAAELFFRAQRISLEGGRIMAADAEAVDFHASSANLGGLVRLALAAEPVVELDVLDERTAERYFGRDERYDTVLDLSFASPGLDALARVLEAWVRHLLGVVVSIQPTARVADERWAWHSGLDADSSAILNELYRGGEVEPAALERLLALFRLEFADRSAMRRELAGRPVYLGLAMSAERTLRLKPQNLIVNLPLRARS
ncbi:MAG TPA: DUF6352 family protein [Alphaproteobacteria bacterium]|nr:DUF6352 family protein [Alphaproteobacteria bacterium]